MAKTTTSATKIEEIVLRRGSESGSGAVTAMQLRYRSHCDAHTHPDYNCSYAHEYRMKAEHANPISLSTLNVGPIYVPDRPHEKFVKCFRGIKFYALS